MGSLSIRAATVAGAAATSSRALSLISWFIIIPAGSRP
jgi:hypothetical protein